MQDLTPEEIAWKPTTSGARGSSSYTRSVDNLRNKPKVTDLMVHGRGYLTDKSGQAEVKLDWHLNELADRDKIFKITINGEEAFVDLEELLFYTRVMFT